MTWGTSEQGSVPQNSDISKERYNRCLQSQGAESNLSEIQMWVVFFKIDKNSVLSTTLMPSEKHTEQFQFDCRVPWNLVTKY